MRSNAAILGLTLSLAAIAGCSNAHEATGDAGSPLGDAAPVTDASVGQACGATTCAVGLVCCNASCGICTRPDEGCVALDCSDAGPPQRLCGGIAGLPCDPTDYCDFPDGSFCGGDDEQGVCRPRPTECPPGGVEVCGCDGTDYLGECAAYASGIDVAHTGACESPPPPSNSISATATCAPWDGAAWRFVITDGAPVCTGIPSTASLSIDVWSFLEGEPANTTYVIGTDTTSQGQATYCPSGGGGPPCSVLTGTITMETFTTSGFANFSYALHDASGTSYTGTHVSVGLWCASERFCG